MKTVLIYDQLGEGPIKFYILDRDYSHLDGVYINDSNVDEALQEELSKLIYDPVTGCELQCAREYFPSYAVKDGALVIVAGFLP